MGYLSLGNGLKSIVNPAGSIIDDSKSDDPLTSFLDPFSAFSGLLASSPALPQTPGMPSMPVKYSIPFKPFKTNYGSFQDPIMQDVLNKLHPSVPYQAPTGGSSASGGGGTSTPSPAPTPAPAPAPTPAPAPPPTPKPTPPGRGPTGPGAPTQPNVVNRPTAAQGYARQYAQTPNTVVSRSSMTVPGTAVVTQGGSAAPTMSSGIKPGLLGGGAMGAGGAAPAGVR